MSSIENGGTKMSNNITNCKNIQTAIRRAEKALISEAKKSGLYEDFGQKEVRMIQDKFVNISVYNEEMNRKRDLLQSFSKWCSTLTLSKIKTQ
jgi:hypothetical protein